MRKKKVIKTIYCGRKSSTCKKRLVFSLSQISYFTKSFSTHSLVHLTPYYSCQLFFIFYSDKTEIMLQFLTSKLQFLTSKQVDALNLYSVQCKISKQTDQYNFSFTKETNFFSLLFYLHHDINLERTLTPFLSLLLHIREILYLNHNHISFI